jgi:hypothetical protein
MKKKLNTQNVKAIFFMNLTMLALLGMQWPDIAPLETFVGVALS